MARGGQMTGGLVACLALLALQSACIATQTISVAAGEPLERIAVVVFGSLPTVRAVDGVNLDNSAFLNRLELSPGQHDFFFRDKFGNEMTVRVFVEAGHCYGVTQLTHIPERGVIAPGATYHIVRDGDPELSDLGPTSSSDERGCGRTRRRRR
jgi:hypothetical protein